MQIYFQFKNFWWTWVLVLAIFLVRYIVIAGSAYLIIWRWNGEKFKNRLIQEKIREAYHLRRDFLYSLLTSIIFATIGFFILIANRMGYTQIYHHINERGIVYFFLSIFIILIIHDTFFYWAHRFMHLPGIYRRVHLVHHLSKNPSPWTAFAFHPYESVLEAMIMPLIVFTIPVHFYALVIFLIIMTTMNVIGHLGYELYPKGLLRNPFWKWNNTSTHHNMHHNFVSCNYGLYFNWWDTWMKTNHPDYIKTFESIKNRG